MLGSSVLFAVMATCVGAAHRRDPALSTWVASAARSGVNLLALLVLARGDLAQLLGDRRPALWARGITGAASLLAYFGALAALGVGEAAFLNQTSAVWVALLGPLVLREHTGRLVWVAVLGSLGGVALLAAPREGGADLVGRALGLASGLAAALAYLSVRRASATNTAITVVFYFTAMATVVSVAVALALRTPWPRDPVELALLVGAGLSATLAQLGMTRAYAISRAAPVAAAGAASPLFTTLLGALFLGQIPDRRAQIGMALLLLTGVLLPWLAERRHQPR